MLQSTGLDEKFRKFLAGWPRWERALHTVSVLAFDIAADRISQKSHG